MEFKWNINCSFQNAWSTICWLLANSVQGPLRAMTFNGFYLNKMGCAIFTSPHCTPSTMLKPTHLVCVWPFLKLLWVYQLILVGAFWWAGQQTWYHMIYVKAVHWSDQWEQCHKVVNYFSLAANVNQDKMRNCFLSHFQEWLIDYTLFSNLLCWFSDGYLSHSTYTEYCVFQ